MPYHGSVKTELRILMNDLERKLKHKKRIRVIGFDDSPFDKQQSQKVHIAGIVCSNTRFEGMLWGEVTKDGNDATDIIIDLICQSKFHQQIDLVILDGIAVGGFNIIRLKDLSQNINRPCIAVMRKPPNLSAIDQALANFDDMEQRQADIQQAGPILQRNGFVFQVVGCSDDIAALVLAQLTDTGHVPEALRLAHLIGSAIKTGESSRRA